MKLFGAFMLVGLAAFGAQAQQKGTWKITQPQ